MLTFYKAFTKSSSGIEKNGNLLETTKNRDNSSFPVGSISGKPLCGYHYVSIPGNSQPEDYTLFPRIYNFRKPYKWFSQVSIHVKF